MNPKTVTGSRCPWRRRPRLFSGSRAPRRGAVLAPQPAQLLALIAGQALGVARRRRRPGATSCAATAPSSRAHAPAAGSAGHGPQHRTASRRNSFEYGGVFGIDRHPLRPGQTAQPSDVHQTGGTPARRRGGLVAASNSPKTRQKLGQNRSRASEPRTRGRDREKRSSCKYTRSSESCSAPERIRTSDLRFRRPTASATDMALGSQISNADSPKTRQRLNHHPPGHTRFSFRERARVRRRHGRPRVVPSRRAVAAGADAPLSKEQRASRLSSSSGRCSVSSKSIARGVSLERPPVGCFRYEEAVSSRGAAIVPIAAWRSSPSRLPPHGLDAGA